MYLIHSLKCYKNNCAERAVRILGNVNLKKKRILIAIHVYNQFDNRNKHELHRNSFEFVDAGIAS